MDIQYVLASWLKQPSLMPPGTAQKLAKAGLTTEDYAQILACNPFSSSPNPAIDPNRFVLTQQGSGFTYEPPARRGDPVVSTTYTQTSATTNTTTAQTKVQYGVTLKEGVSGILADVLKFKVSGTLEWTNTSTSTQTTGSSQSATVTIGGPSFGYTGPTEVFVYWDTVYSSFMFTFANP
jgi:hypothetical protein